MLGMGPGMVKNTRGLPVSITKPDTSDEDEEDTSEHEKDVIDEGDTEAGEEDVIVKAKGKSLLPLCFRWLNMSKSDKKAMSKGKQAGALVVIYRLQYMAVTRKSDCFCVGSSHAVAMLAGRGMYQNRT